jgi:uncharacterized protein YciI
MKFVILKTTVGDRETFQRHLDAYYKYLELLHRQQTLLMAGTFDDRSGGMLLVEAKGLEQAISIARNDPLVTAGVDRYLVRGWTPNLAFGESEAPNGSGPIKPVESGPLFMPSGENFKVIDVGEHPEGEELQLRCFAPRQVARDEASRREYLRLARGRGLGRLLLMYEDQLAGQIEFAPPGGSGLPIDGPEGLIVINCLWVVDAFTGLEGGRRLLATCAEKSGAVSLATVGYNATLPLLPRTFFERQGFSVIDEVETGRFFGNTPVVAHLLWRPLTDGLHPPTWDRDRLLEGVSFCPGYPWLFGKRLYWGRDYAYHCTVVREGLRRAELLNRFPCLGEKRIDRWTVVKIGVPEADLNRAIDLIQGVLISEPTYFASFTGMGRMIVVYPDRVFHATMEPESWDEAFRYGQSKGIPEDELLFTPPF